MPNLAPCQCPEAVQQARRPRPILASRHHQHRILAAQISLPLRVELNRTYLRMDSLTNLILLLSAAYKASIQRCSSSFKTLVADFQVQVADFQVQVADFRVPAILQ